MDFQIQIAYLLIANCRKAANGDSSHNEGEMSAAITAIDLSQLDLLVIDDNRFIRQLLTEILRSFGANTIRESDCSEDAFRQMDRKVPDLIFCDWMMNPV